MFRIEEKPGDGNVSFTHNIYFKEKLLSEKGYLYKGIFNYDDYSGKRMTKFLELKISDLPDRLCVNTGMISVHREFDLRSFTRKGNKIIFCLNSVPEYFNDTPWNFIMFFDKTAHRGKKMFGLKSFIYSEHDGMDLDIPVDYREDEKVKDACRRAKKIFVKVYDRVIKDMMVEAKKF